MQPPPELVDFFDDIKDFSADYLSSIGAPASGSPNGGKSLRPVGIVLHYTVDPSARSVCRWLCAPESKASAHYIIAQGRVAPMRSRSESSAYHMPASIVQLRSPSSTAWHATWTNDHMLGIEICNGGEVRFNQAGTPHTFCHGDGWQPTANPYVHNPIRAGGRTFCGYNDAQLCSITMLVYALCQQFHIPLGNVVGHDMVQGRFTRGAGGFDKRDLGGFDLSLLRAQVMGMNHQDFWNVYSRASRARAEVPLFGLQKHFEPIGANASADWAMRCEAKKGSEQAMYRLMRDLGYDVDRLGEQNGKPQTEHYALFQRMMGLEPDGIMGPLTRAAVCTRHADRLSVPLPVTRGQGVA